MAETPAPTTSAELVTTLPKTLIRRLEAEAKRQALSVDALINEAIEIYLDELEDDDDEEYEDTPDEEILADFRQAWHEAMTGDVIPADEALAELRKKLANADKDE